MLNALATFVQHKKRNSHAIMQGIHLLNDYQALEVLAFLQYMDKSESFNVLIY